MVKSNVAAVILAAGSGTRMRSDITKQRMMLCGKTVIKRTVDAFMESPYIKEIVIVCREDEIEILRGDLYLNAQKPIRIVKGGACRAESARLGFEAVSEDTEYVAIHDGARCLITADMIRRVIESAYLHGGAFASSLIFDTVKAVDDSGRVTHTLDRGTLRRAATPQVFKSSVYRQALSCYSGNIEEITDDNMLLEAMGIPVYAVDLEGENIKITTARDLRYAEFVLKERGEAVD